MVYDRQIVHSTGGASLGEVLERILDKGVVIAGDITVAVADIELLSIRIRLVVASVEKAMEMGIDWWTNDPALSSRAERNLEEPGHQPQTPRIKTTATTERSG